MTNTEKRLEEFDEFVNKFTNEQPNFHTKNCRGNLHDRNCPTIEIKKNIKAFLATSITQAEQEGYKRGEQNIVKKLNEFGFPCRLLNGELHIISKPLTDKE